MNKLKSNYKHSKPLKKKNSEEEENDVDQNVKPGQQPGKPAPPDKPGKKSDGSEKDVKEEDYDDTTPPGELKSPGKARKEARKISEAEGIPQHHKK